MTVGVASKDDGERAFRETMQARQWDEHTYVFQSLHYQGLLADPLLEDTIYFNKSPPH